MSTVGGLLMPAAATRWIADASDRLAEHIEKAVAADHLNLVVEIHDSESGGSLRGTEAVVYATSLIIELWNEQADKIDVKFGKGFFGLRLGHANAYSFSFIPEFPGARWRAKSVLCFLSATARTPIIDWMLDLMTIIEVVPEKRIHNEATAKNGLWDRKLRKRVEYIQLARQLAMDEQIRDIEGLARSKLESHLKTLRGLTLFCKAAEQPPVTSAEATSHPGMEPTK